MACGGSYLDATQREIAISQILCILDELEGRKFTDSDWQGYHRGIKPYCKSSAALDALVADLCARLQVIDVSKHSLEMQIWWRDHQLADKERVEKELAEQKEGLDKKAAIAKLTQYERKLLGIKFQEENNGNQ